MYNEGKISKELYMIYINIFCEERGYIPSFKETDSILLKRSKETYKK